MLFRSTNTALENKDIKFEISKSAKKYILEKGTDLKYGARPLRRSIQRYIEDEISEMILKGDLVSGNTISVDCKKEKLSFKVK